MRYIKIFI